MINLSKRRDHNLHKSMLNHKVAYPTIKTVIFAVNEAEKKGEQYNARRKNIYKRGAKKDKK